LSGTIEGEGPLDTLRYCEETLAMLREGLDHVDDDEPDDTDARRGSF
jgi:hypothetical protein